MSRDQLKRLKELEVWNTRLRRMVSDLTLEKMIPVRAAKLLGSVATFARLVRLAREW